jgi:hypothetical protein
MPRHTEIAHLSSPYLDKINDAYIGSGSSTGTGSDPYPGQLGAFMELTEAEAAAMSSSSSLTFLSGIYQYVKFISTSTDTVAAGQVVLWSAPGTYVVTPDASGVGVMGFWAGIALCAVTKGQYGWIQVAGRANVLFKGSLTAATPAIGDVVIVDQSGTTTGLFGDVPTQSSFATTYQLFKSILGVAETAPAASTKSVVQLYPRFWNE